MDQFASSVGGAGAALLLDCRSLDYRVVPIGLDDVAIVVTDSGSSRRLDASAYNERRAQAEAAVEVIERSFPEVHSLRDVTAAMLDALADDLDPVLLRRARHVVEEDARVLEAADALESGDAERTGRLFSQSHSSLRDLYDVSRSERPQLMKFLEVLAARRAMLKQQREDIAIVLSEIEALERQCRKRLRRSPGDGAA